MRFEGWGFGFEVCSCRFEVVGLSFFALPTCLHATTASPTQRRNCDHIVAVVVLRVAHPPRTCTLTTTGIVSRSKVLRFRVPSRRRPAVDGRPRGSTSDRTARGRVIRKKKSSLLCYLLLVRTLSTCMYAIYRCATRCY